MGSRLARRRVQRVRGGLGVTTPEIPAAARTLLRQLDGWSVAGPWAGITRHTAYTLSETEDGNGRRKRVELVETVELVGIRACHVDGRNFYAQWMRRPGRGWTLDAAVVRRLYPADGHGPACITATALKAYVSAPDAAAALAACGSGQVAA